MPIANDGRRGIAHGMDTRITGATRGGDRRRPWPFGRTLTGSVSTKFVVLLENGRALVGCEGFYEDDRQEDARQSSRLPSKPD